MEDGVLTIDLNLSIYDPQDPTGSLIINTLDEMSAVLTYQNDGTFILNPPQDHFGLECRTKYNGLTQAMSSYLKVIFILRM